ncbi:MAG TPA: Ig-like domain-containing protein [Longimicrobium sp.]|jgi:hypothetical protein|nr:Ig-like domain-containing protein [Longimicrobium sp.]
MKRTLLVLLFALAGLPACKDSTGSTGGPLTALSVSPSPLYLGVGDTVTLSAIGTKSDKTTAPAAASFKSSNTAVATVSGSGLVRGVSVGTAQVTVTAGGQTSIVTVNVLAAGGIRTFNVNDQNCDNPTYHGARLAASSTHALIYEDVTNPTGGFTDADYQSIITELENVVWPTDTQNFGTPSDIDGNGKIIVLYTRAVNDLTPVGAGFIYGGFFHPRDVFPRTPQGRLDGCLGSNVAEMFYMLAPDPTGVSNGHVRTKAYVRGNTVGTIGHEFQHLINTSRRVHVNNSPELFEAVWLDEGLAHTAEELNFYTASGLAPRQNLGQAEVLATQARVNAFNEFQLENFGRLDEYLRAPAANAPYAGNDDLATRGATWSFLRYSADRRGGAEQSFWFALVNSQTTGLANLQNVLGTDPVLWANDWAVANYTDDAVPVTAVFTHPSWKFRDLYANAAFGGFHLQVTALPVGLTSASVKSGSAGYYKFGVAAAQTADVRVAPTGTTVAGACTPVALAVGGVQQLTPGAAGVALCFPGGGDYALIPFHANNSLDQTFAVSITATSVIAAIPPPSPNRIPTAPLFALDGESLTHPWDGGMEVRMRERAYAELRQKVHGAAAPRADANVVGSSLYVNVVRIR